MNCFNQLLTHVEKLMPLADFNTPHDLCLKKYPAGRHGSSPLKRHHFKKENNENDFGGSTSSLDDAGRQSPEPSQQVSTGDRLVQLIVKGVLYENCVNYCEQVATSNTYSTAFRRAADAKDHADANDDEDEKASMSSLDAGKPGGKVQRPVDFSNILTAADNGKADLKLLNWLTSLPKESFNYYFDGDSPLPLKIEQCEKPALAANWSETILGTPIKPKVYPPFGGAPFAKLPPTIVGNGPTTTLNNNAAPTNNSLQLHPAGQQLSLANSQQASQQLASLLSNLGADGPAATGDQLGNLLSLINQMNQGGQPNGFSAPQVPNSQNSGAKGSPANLSELKQLYQTLLIEDLTKPAIGARDRGMAEPNENGIPKLDFLAHNFSQLTSLNDLSGSNLFGLTNGNGLNGGHPASPHHGPPPPTDSLLASLSKSQLNSLLQSANLSSLLNGNALAEIGQSLNGQSDEGAASLMMNAKLTAKVPKEIWMKKQNTKKNHLFVVNDGNKLNHSFVTNQSLFIDDDLCGKGNTGKRAKQYKKRDNPVSILSYIRFYFRSSGFTFQLTGCSLSPFLFLPEHRHEERMLHKLRHDHHHALASQQRGRSGLQRVRTLFQTLQRKFKIHSNFEFLTFSIASNFLCSRDGHFGLPYDVPFDIVSVMVLFTFSTVRLGIS